MPVQASDVLKHLTPALGRGIKRNTSEQGGLDALINALSKGNHDRYLDDPRSVTQDDAINDGNGILGHIFGSKDVSRKGRNPRGMSKRAVSDSLIKKMLPMVAALAMGALNKQRQAEPNFAEPAQSSGGGLLDSFLDADKDGSIMDDLLGMAGKFPALTATRLRLPATASEALAATSC